MAGRGERGQRPARTSDGLAVAKHTVWPVIRIEGRIGTWLIAVQHQRRAAHDRRARERRQRRGGRRMVAMSVRAADRQHGHPADTALQSVEVLRQVGPGVDHSQSLGVANKIGLVPV